MKRSTEVLLFAAALAVAAIVPQLNAQDNPAPASKGPRGPRPGMEILSEHAAKQLGLSEDQKTKIKAIHEAARPQMDAIRDDKALSKQQKREKAEAIMKDTQAKVDEVLTPEQRTKAQAMREKMRERMKEHKGGKGPHGPGQDGPPPAEEK